MPVCFHMMRKRTGFEYKCDFNSLGDYSGEFVLPLFPPCISHLKSDTVWQTDSSNALCLKTYCQPKSRFKDYTSSNEKLNHLNSSADTVGCFEAAVRNMQVKACKQT